MAEIKKKMAYAKAVDADKKTVTAYVSTFGWDRTLERFEKGAWDLENFKKNPVVLWGHDGSSPPIGRAIDVVEDENGLLATTEFDVASEKGAEIFGLFQRGFLNAFSVGFIPKRMQLENVEGSQDKGIVFVDAELLEYSAVSIPANPGAVIGRELAELAIKALGPTSVSKVNEDSFLVTPPIPEVKAAPATEPAKEEVVVEKAAEPAQGQDLEAALKQIITIARVVKGNPLDENKRKLLGTAAALLNEAISESNVDMDPEMIKDMGQVVDSLANLVKVLNPDIETLVQKTIEQIRKATN